MNIIQAIENESITENGAIGYRSTGKALLDLNFAVASLRNVDDQEIIRRFKSAYDEDKALAVKWAFYARDIRGGIGERRLFRTICQFIVADDPQLMSRLIPIIPTYGRFDDLWALLDTPELRHDVGRFVSAQLNSDLKSEHPSLLAKWMPSANASSKESKRLAKILQSELHMNDKAYRTVLSTLRKRINVVERDMSSNNWQGINYETVPSRANLIYRNAFMRHDEERRQDYLAAVAKGDAKINASTLFPCDIVHKYGFNCWEFRASVDAAIEALWNALPNTVNGCGNTIVVADSSGSMDCNVSPSSNVSALNVATSMAIYFAERSSGYLKDKYITFSRTPQLVDLSPAKTLVDKLEIALSYIEATNTNIEATFDLILNAAVREHLRQDELPANVLIISDMEFDAASGYGTDKALFDLIASRFEAHGYKMPRLVFWNVASRTGTIPVRENENGVALVSGFSPNLCRLVMSGKTDPFECLLDTLNSERYAYIGKLVQ